MKKKIRTVVIAVLVIIGLALLSFWYKAEEGSRRGVIKVSGNIEATDVRLSFRVGGKIVELLTDEGRVIGKGDLVARLDPDELTKIRDEAEANLTATKYEYERARDDYIRAENLFAAGSIPEQKRDAARTKAESLAARVEALEASLALADTRLGFVELRSPLNGFVLVKSAEAGEVVAPGSPVFTTADIRNIWLTAYIDETFLGKVKLGQEAYVKTDSYSDKEYPGYLSFIAQEAEFTPKHIQTTEERVKLVYRIKIKLDNSSLDLKPGMPGDGYIKINRNGDY